MIIPAVQPLYFRRTLEDTPGGKFKGTTAIDRRKVSVEPLPPVRTENCPTVPVRQQKVYWWQQVCPSHHSPAKEIPREAVCSP